MATLPPSPITLQQLQTANWSRISNVGDRVQNWTGALDNSESAECWWDSVTGLCKVFTDGSRREVVLLGLWCWLLADNIVAPSGLAAAAKTTFKLVLDQTVLK